MNARETLFEKIAALPEERIAEIEDFVDFIHVRGFHHPAEQFAVEAAPVRFANISLRA